MFSVYKPVIDNLWRNNAIKSVKVQRLEARSWLPLFYVVASDGTDQICSLRSMNSGELRVWYDLTILVEWLRSDFQIYSATVSLSNAQIFQSGEN